MHILRIFFLVFHWTEQKEWRDKDDSEVLNYIQGSLRTFQSIYLQPEILKATSYLFKERHISPSEYLSYYPADNINI